jgi:tRNA dimethylallyltransferase
MYKQKVIVILGPTATGKSDLAVKIALRLRSESSTKKNGGEIISADSRQVYLGLDIGTGKITKKEMKGVPHHLIDVANPKIKFTVAEYQKKAIYAIAEMVKNDMTPIICGGTGFYIDSITKGLIFPEVKPNIKLRKILEKKESIELFKILQKLDKRRAKDIKTNNEINNKVRLIRAIEIAKAIGKVPKIKIKKLPYKFVKIGLYLPDDISKQKIEKRVKQMFKDGLISEISNLKKNGISNMRLKEFGFEYNNPTIESVILETQKYVKRQMTWFKRDKDIIWFDASQKNLLEKILLEIKKDF